MASGQTLGLFVPGDGSFDPSYPVVFGPDANKNICYQFSSIAEGHLIIDSFIGQQYGGNGVTFVLAWCCTAGTGVVNLAVAVQRLYAGVVLSSGMSWVQEQLASVTVPGVAYQMVYTTLTIPSGSFPVQPGEMYRIRVRRDVTPTSNSSGVAELFRVMVKEA